MCSYYIREVSVFKDAPVIERCPFVDYIINSRNL
jgi:hypothetical protein